ncbi:hypothetical protein CQ14_16210 [Bradyrhizobium lablabi]|uniref:Tetratricopeptide repeat-containing protein n=1 Tax=Bradyrhizobium lablabi TaxID=722472 RepID=A0A0R3M891_9BRAD|nr:hypothetical protein [Bradyrhizobium lablabi]KRR16418.1 hypothetical protein CQ14_16210 [Bradyrhizobium lablabi]
MSAKRPSLMTRAIFTSLFFLGLCSATAQPVAQTSGVDWNECLKAPTRACVLREAAEVARTIGDPRLAANALGRIAEVQFKAGLSAEAAATIDQALQVATSIADDGYPRDNAIETIAKVLAKAGKPTDALDIVGSIKNRYIQAEVLGAVAVAEGKAGRLDEALRRVRAIENLRDRALIMRRVAWDLGASAVARGEDDKIAAALADVQAIEQQYDLWPLAMTGIHHPSEFVPALAIIAQAQARAGKIEDAMRVSRRVTRSSERAQALATIATELVRAGAVALALKVARSVDNRWERGVVLERVLEPRPMPERVADEATTSGSPMKAETPDEVRDVVAAFTDREQRATVLGIVAVASANAGRLAQAIEFAEPIDRGKPRAFAWYAIAKAQAKAGLTVQSIASFERAAQAALSFEPHDQLLSSIATSQAEASKIDEAVRVTQLIGGTVATAGSLSQIMVDGKLVDTDHDRRSALLAIAKAQAKAGRNAEALQGAQAFKLGPDIIPPGARGSRRGARGGRTDRRGHRRRRGRGEHLSSLRGARVNCQGPGCRREVRRGETGDAAHHLGTRPGRSLGVDRCRPGEGGPHGRCCG